MYFRYRFRHMATKCISDTDTKYRTLHKVYLDTDTIVKALRYVVSVITICKQRRHTKLQVYKAMLEF